MDQLGPGSFEFVPAKQGTRAERAEATRAAVVDAARQLFAEKGFAATGTGEIVDLAGVGTRGALYHHFPDKQTLFEAVFKVVQDELVEAIASRVAPKGTDPLDDLRDELAVFLDCVVERRDARALLTEGPSALGWKRFRATEFAYGAQPIEAILSEARRAGIVAAAPTGALARLIVAAIDAAAIEIAEAPKPATARKRVGAALDALVGGLRIDGTAD